MRLYVWERFEPLKATRAGLAIAKYFGENSTLGTGRDGHSVSRFVRRCIVNGLVNYGTQVLDFRLVPSQAIRYGIVSQKLDGAVYVSYYKNEIQIHVYGRDGRNLGAEEQVKIRVEGERTADASSAVADMGSLIQYTNGIDDYVEHILGSAGSVAGGRWLLDTQGDPITIVAESIFNRLKIEHTVYNPMLTSESRAGSRESFLSAMKEGNFDHGAVIERDELLGARYFDRDGRETHFDSFEKMLKSVSG